MIFRPKSSDGTCDIIVLKMKKFWIGRPKIVEKHNFFPIITHFMINSTRPIAKMALVSHIWPSPNFFCIFSPFLQFSEKNKKIFIKIILGPIIDL